METDRFVAKDETVTRELDSVPMFSRRLLIYVPVYECRDTIIGVLSSIPEAVSAIADILVVDNCSPDGSGAAVVNARRAGQIRSDVTVVQPSRNIGYAGSQKLAYSLACRSPTVEWVAMLHGDGQYPPALLDTLVARLDSKAGIIYGHRSKLWHPFHEETPISTWLIIRCLSILESMLTGAFRLEWHSGFVMHATRFLRRVNLDALTSTPHIDGHLLYAAHALRERVETVPIFKLYKSLSPFEGAARRQYVIDVLKLMVAMPKQRHELTASGPESHDPNRHAGGHYTVLT